MSFEKLSILGAECEAIADGVVYASTPLITPFYSNVLGGYIQELDKNRVRISDNADILFEAITHGVNHSVSRVKNIESLVKSFGAEVSDAGEIALVCNKDELDYCFSRFIEASFSVASATLDWHPKIKKSHNFKHEIGSILTREYKERLTKNVRVTGSSGHQLSFHFVLDSEQANEQLIQTLSFSGENSDWGQVYSTLGKMLDISRIRDSKRVIIIENADSEEFVSASTLLSEKAMVIPFVGEAKLVEALVA